jgi:hypothetical protein
MRQAGWYTVAGSAVVLTGSAVVFGLAAGEHSDMVESRPNRDATHAFDRDFTAAKILTLVGVVGLGTGITLVLASPKEHEVSVTAGLGALSLSGNF